MKRHTNVGSMDTAWMNFNKEGGTSSHKDKTMDRLNRQPDWMETKIFDRHLENIKRRNRELKFGEEIPVPHYNKEQTLINIEDKLDKLLEKHFPTKSDELTVLDIFDDLSNM